jgi:Phosphoinositide phospholipase C, Ca2+-dependent
MASPGSTSVAACTWRGVALGALCLAGLGCAKVGSASTAGVAGHGAAGQLGQTGQAGTTAPTGAAGTSGGAGLQMTDGGLVASDGARPLDGGDAATAGKGDGPAAEVARLTSMTVEALQVAGTHNSYHQAPLIAFDASHAYTQKPLDQQLAGGVRSLELDLHLASDGTFQIYHIAIIDPNSSCQTLEECLGIVATWSTAHPRHTPIFIWFELKDDTGGSPITDAVPVEAVILKVFARARIMTPAWLRGSYASPRARLTAVGWPALDEARGMVMFSIITHDARTMAYSHGGTSLDDRLMWVSAIPTEFAQPWAVITKDNEQPDVIASAHAAHILLGVNVCAINLTDDVCTTRLHDLGAAGIHMLQDDLPFQIPGRSYWLKLPGGSPGCNPVTAPLSCSTPLE